jgi:hypothetical protein
MPTLPPSLHLFCKIPMHAFHVSHLCIIRFHQVFPKTRQLPPSLHQCMPTLPPSLHQCMPTLPPSLHLFCKIPTHALHLSHFCIIRFHQVFPKTRQVESNLYQCMPTYPPSLHLFCKIPTHALHVSHLCIFNLLENEYK